MSENLPSKATLVALRTCLYAASDLEMLILFVDVSTDVVNSGLNLKNLFFLSQSSKVPKSGIYELGERFHILFLFLRTQFDCFITVESLI